MKGVVLCALCTLMMATSIRALAVGPQVYSIWDLTTEKARGGLEDVAFRADLTVDGMGEGVDKAIKSAGVNSQPVFGLSDVQSGVDRVSLKYGAALASHAHPRASETLYVESGELLSHLRFEGDAPGARVVQLVLRRGRVTVFPQGLPHAVRCNARNGCSFLSFYNSADFGKVAAPAFADEN